MEGESIIKLTREKLLSILFVFLISIALTAHLAFAQWPLNGSVKTNATSYQVSKNVKVSGNVTLNGALVSSGLAGIQVIGPEGTLVARARPVGPIGQQTFGGMQIVLVTLSDEFGNPQNTIIRGDSDVTAYFTVVVNSTLSARATVAITLNVYDNDTIPIGFAYVRTQIPAEGTFNATESIAIPPWAQKGTATVYADVWNSHSNDGALPEYNGQPQCPEKASTFAILASQYDQTLPAGVSPQPIQNGTFSVQFDLSPEAMPGFYAVYGTAWCEGLAFYSPAVANFTVASAKLPPHASFIMAPPYGAPNYSMLFDASSSTPEAYNQTITSYSWKFGDGQTGTGATVDHSYSAWGKYQVTLNVTSSLGSWNTTTQTAIVEIVQNVAVVSVSCSTAGVYNGNPAVYNDWKAPVSVTLMNEGTVSETLNVSLYVNGMFNNETTVSNIAPYFGTESATILWLTYLGGLIPGHNYTIKAVSQTLPNDTNDNTLQYGPIFIGLLGDINFHRHIDIMDLVKVTAIYGTKSGNSNYNIMCDLTGGTPYGPDGVINILDVVVVTSKYGQRY
jgi:hypothetical protein